jgi:hypothetical protein
MSNFKETLAVARAGKLFLVSERYFKNAEAYLAFVEDVQHIVTAVEVGPKGTQELWGRSWNCCAQIFETLDRPYLDDTGGVSYVDTKNHEMSMTGMDLISEALTTAGWEHSVLFQEMADEMRHQFPHAQQSKLSQDAQDSAKKFIRKYGGTLGFNSDD